MASHPTAQLKESDLKRLPPGIAGLWLPLLMIGVTALVIAGVWGVFADARRLAHAYLFAFAFVLSIAVGSLFFLVLTILFRAGWVILIRRVWETYAATLGVIGLLSLPILLFTLSNTGILYEWAQPIENVHFTHDPATKSVYGHEGQPLNTFDNPHAPKHDAGHGADAGAAEAPHGAENTDADGEHAEPHATHGANHTQDAGHAASTTATTATTDAGHVVTLVADTPEAHGDGQAEEHADAGGHGVHIDPMLEGKRPWLNVPFFIVRVIGYMVFFAVVGWWYRATSIRQDESGDPRISHKLDFAAPGTILASALVLTFAAIDLLMSLDWTWYSTMFPVCYFAGCIIAALATGILTLMALQKAGCLGSVSVEHYHDVAKLMFAFIVFWAYVTYSQYMLIWYASLPATTVWFDVRGISSDPQSAHYWSFYGQLMVFLLFGHFIVPFLFLLNRRVKRYMPTLAVACVWLLVMHALNLFWIVMPEWSYRGADLLQMGGPWLEILCLVGMVAIVLATAIKLAASASLVPKGDPRLKESLMFRQAW